MGQTACFLSQSRVSWSMVRLETIVYEELFQSHPAHAEKSLYESDIRRSAVRSIEQSLDIRNIDGLWSEHADSL